MAVPNDKAITVKVSLHANRTLHVMINYRTFPITNCNINKYIYIYIYIYIYMCVCVCVCVYLAYLRLTRITNIYIYI